MLTVITPRGVSSPYRERTLPDGRQILWKSVRPKQELITPAGIAVDESILDDAARSGRVGVGLLRVQTGEELWAPLVRWRRGIAIRRGFGDQRALLWSQLEPLPDSNRGQLALFAETAR